MKTKLLFLTLLISYLGFSQTPISSYYSVDGSGYAVVTSTPAIDQTATGNQTWNFTNLTANGATIDSYAAPTSGELTTYPGTTSVWIVTDNAMETNKIFTKDVSNTVSYTGVERTDLVLNYSDNALIGTFPMSYNATSSDAVAGSFTYTTFSGTFTGTIVTTADAYGTLNMNDVGDGAYTGSVTRLKIVQTLTLTVPFVGSVPASQTSYNYYDNANGHLVFRTNNLKVDLLSVNETIMESFLPNSLGTNNNVLSANQIKIVPNIVENTLNIYAKNDTVIRSVIVTDMNGRTVLNVE
ncbi:MAG: hypothetical protein KDC68_02715 [Gelidibacter sp.]|nr:hypothetical protein [Gelidibacter sp.]